MYQTGKRTQDKQTISSFVHSTILAQYNMLEV